MASRSLGKTFLGYKIGKRLGEDLHHKLAEEKFTMASSLRKGWLGAYGQEETYLKVSEATGKAKALLVYLNIKIIHAAAQQLPISEFCLLSLAPLMCGTSQFILLIWRRKMSQHEAYIWKLKAGSYSSRLW